MIEFDLRKPRRLAPGFLAAILLGALSGELAPESVTLTTYYPAPSGVYTQLVTTGNTYLARDGASSVGIGTTSPDSGAKLHVVGTAGFQNNGTFLEGRASGGAVKMRFKIESPNLNFYGYDSAEFNFMRVSNSGVKSVYFPVKVGFNSAMASDGALDVTGVVVSKQPEAQCVTKKYFGGTSTSCDAVNGMPAYATLLPGIMSVQSMAFLRAYATGTFGDGYMLCCQCPTNPCPTLPE